VIAVSFHVQCQCNFLFVKSGAGTSYAGVNEQVAALLVNPSEMMVLIPFYNFCGERNVARPVCSCLCAATPYFCYHKIKLES
jgi:hypothetical protein